MASTWLPDTNDTGDIMLSALGGALGLLTYAWLTSVRSYSGKASEKKSPPSLYLALGPKIYAPAFVAAGVVGGHKLYENLEGHFETKRLLGQ